MERKLFLGQFLIWVVLLLGQLHGCKSCIEKERKALLELKKHLISLSVEWGYDTVQPTWTNDTKSDCCLWEGLECNRTSGRVIGISIGDMVFENFSSPLNISLLQPFEDIRSLSLSVEQNGFDGFFDDVEGILKVFHSVRLPFLMSRPCRTTLQSIKYSVIVKTEEHYEVRNLKLLYCLYDSNNQYFIHVYIGA